MLVKDVHALLGTLRRLHALNEGVVFWNEQRTFKIMLRNDPVDADTLACEAALVFEEDDEVMAGVLDLCNDGYMDDPTTYVMHTWSFPMAEVGVEDASKVQRALNDLHMTRVCDCAKYLVKDDATMCFYCHMTSTLADREHHFCPICCEEGLAMHMSEQPCCKQRLHARCMATWKSKSGDDRCPLCRRARVS